MGIDYSTSARAAGGRATGRGRGMTRELYVDVLKSVHAQLMLAADALDMCGTCGVAGATGNELARRLRLSAAVRQCVLMLELDIEAAGRLVAHVAQWGQEGHPPPPKPGR